MLIFFKMPKEDRKIASETSSLFLNWRFWVWVLSILAIIFIWILFLKRRPARPAPTPTLPPLPTPEEGTKPPPQINPEDLSPEQKKALEDWAKKVEEQIKKELEKGTITPLPPPPSPPPLPSLP
jgi:hypothetical protein